MEWRTGRGCSTQCGRRSAGRWSPQDDRAKLLEENTLDERIRQMIRELEQALSGAFAESEDVHEVLRRLRDEGYGLIFVLDRRDGRDPAAEEGSDGDRGLSPRASGDPVAHARLARLSSSAPGAESGRPGSAAEPPSFRIDAADLAFLRSIGIDPTRKIRGRRAPHHPLP